ncbi:hypothetical protein HNY73_017937 [Argiope bruennichi]|uniref:SOCS box domain-containing protein n=1 Tax=Argiope bruennichi TaxID=94029 RepID=A0A8T0ECE0_ARGBR|nr:hypothetical protein HNY73_017937 [Argiope bruennichi]
MEPPGRQRRLRNLSAASATLRLVWHSDPDIFLTLGELTETYEAGWLSPEVITDIYSFYCQAVGKVASTVEPRSLQHYCRTTIRRILYENNQWLPEGIGSIGIPLKLQSYLNL